MNSEAEVESDPEEMAQFIGSHVRPDIPFMSDVNSEYDDQENIDGEVRMEISRGQAGKGETFSNVINE